MSRRAFAGSLLGHAGVILAMAMLRVPSEAHVAASMGTATGKQEIELSLVPPETPVPLVPASPVAPVAVEPPPPASPAVPPPVAHVRPTRRAAPTGVPAASPAPSPTGAPRPEAQVPSPGAPGLGMRTASGAHGDLTPSPTGSPRAGTPLLPGADSVGTMLVPRGALDVPGGGGDSDSPATTSLLDPTVPIAGPAGARPKRFYHPGDDRPLTRDWVPDGDGGFHVKRPGFYAHVAKDGHVTFADRPSFQAHVRLPCVSCIGKSLAKEWVVWSKDPYEYTRQMGKRSNQADEGMPLRPVIDTEPESDEPGRLQQRAVAHAPDDNDEAGEMIYLPLISGSFDVTDALMRAHGEDPYRYAKMKFLEDTEGVRAGMSERDGAVVQKDALGRLPGRLEAIWAKTEVPAATRRRSLFLLWDECAEHGEPAIAAAGAKARATIEKFVRERLPAGSADAYDDTELEALNRVRTSRVPFRPYDADVP